MKQITYPIDILRELQKQKTTNASANLPFSKDSFVRVPVRTKEQALYAESLGKQVFVDHISFHDGGVQEIYYCLMEYKVALEHCL